MKGQIGDKWFSGYYNVVIACLTLKVYLLVNNIYLWNVEQIAIELGIYNTMITEQTEILEMKVRQKH